VPEGPGPFPVVTDDPGCQALYEHCRRIGDSHQAALLVAARRKARRLVPLRPFRDDETITFGWIVCEPPVSDDFETLVRYWAMRLDGQSHRFAEMMATRSFPAVKTDATFNRGRCNGNQFEDTPGLGDYYKGMAEAAGVSTTGKHYCSGLADFPGDPTAWISDRGDVLRIARAKGYRVSGDVNYDPGEREPMPDVAIAPDIVNEFVDDYMELDSGERRGDVEERATQLLTGAVDPHPLRVQDPPAGWEDAP
jgi:hypothetical protein